MIEAGSGIILHGFYLHVQSMFRSLNRYIIFRRSASQISAIKFEGKKHECLYTAWKPLQHYVWKSCNYICNDNLSHSSPQCTIDDWFYI